MQLLASECLLYSSKFSNCSNCADICPMQSIQIEHSKLAINSECVECGACAGVCPTEALAFDNFSVTQFFFDFLKSDESVVSCKSNFVCLSALGVEYLIALALGKEETTLDLGHCKECALGEKLFERISLNIDEANYVLGNIGQKSIQYAYLAQSKESNRRDFLNKFTLKEAVKLSQKLEEGVLIELEDFLQKRQKSVPNRRKLLFTLLNRTPKPAHYVLLDSKHINFISSKYIDEQCDNCSMCYRICPSGALSSSKRFDKIYLDEMLCLKCHLCHDVCHSDAMSLAYAFDTKEFFDSTQKELKAFEVIKCNECGNHFTYFGGERVCTRCSLEEAEAKDLWGI